MGNLTGSNVIMKLREYSKLSLYAGKEIEINLPKSWYSKFECNDVYVYTGTFDNIPDWMLDYDVYYVTDRSAVGGSKNTFVLI